MPEAPATRRSRRHGPLYVVEHMEEGLEEWCKLEYRHMASFVPPERLLFLNWPEGIPPSELARSSTAAEDGTVAPELPRMLPQSFETLTSRPTGEGAESEATPSPLPALDRLCLMDMDAPDALQPDDVTRFDALIFGGILGNVHEKDDGTYGSDDRTAELRRLGFANRRHLGPLQMTTDTAVLVSHLVLEEARPLAEIPWIDSPEIEATADEGKAGGCSDSICMEGFRYVARRTADGGDWEPTLPLGMREHLLNSADDDILDSL